MARDHDQWQALTYEAGYALVDAAPEGWRQIELFSRVTAESQDFTLTVLMADGGRAAVEIPAAATQAVLGIRDAYYVEGEGTWFSMRFLIDAPSKLHLLYNLDWDPDWEPGVDPSAWVRDLERYPRDAFHLPPWLREKLAEAGAEVPPAPPEVVELPLDPEGQNQIWMDLSNRIVLTVPADWQQVLLTYRVVGDHVELPVMVRRATDGGLYLWEPPAEVAEMLAKLRAGMYREGRGTWFQVGGTIDMRSHTEFAYVWDTEPSWDGAPPTAALARELELFPRTGVNLPEWIAERVGAAAGATLGAVTDPKTAETEALRAAEDAAAELGLDPARYRIGEVADGAWCLVSEANGWAVFLAVGGERFQGAEFATVQHAVRYFVGHLYLNRSAFRDELAPDAKRRTDEWPIQPLGGDAGLQVYSGKRILTLPPGTEMDRYGEPAGNTLYAVGTEWTYRSQPSNVREREYHVYRLRRPVRGIVGSPIPWYDEAGGGTVYVLERSVADLLADGSLEPVEQPTVRQPTVHPPAQG
ncbi:TNT domain-containing protein [Catenulispora pinisilvae]|uniref:TNT domain-containing protein n=1 Tax=Catenulispora pinisilvae TaxID=2705253 RepID=UPI00189258AC|nr:TNT domain-containing protein [Catenulispora pinisilvae]